MTVLGKFFFEPLYSTPVPGSEAEVLTCPAPRLLLLRKRTLPHQMTTSARGRFCCKSGLLAMDRSAISLRTTGFDPPALTLSTQLKRYRIHKACGGGAGAT